MLELRIEKELRCENHGAHACESPIRLLVRALRIGDSGAPFLHSQVSLLNFARVSARRHGEFAFLPTPRAIR